MENYVYVKEIKRNIFIGWSWSELGEGDGSI